MASWIECHGLLNLRASTMTSYKSIITLHIVPYLGDILFGNVTPATLDDLFQKLLAEGLSSNTVRYV